MWLQISKATGDVVGSPSEKEPTAYDHEAIYVVRTVIGYPDRMRWSASQRGFVDVTTQKFNGTTWVDDPVKVEAALVADVKVEGERRRMLVMSPGGSKKTIYPLKQSEVDTWNDLGSTLATALTAFLGLTAIKQKRKFRFAMAEAALRGEANPAAAIARFAAGSDAANAEAARIEAIEQAGVSAIKGAANLVAKRAAYAAINWNWPS